MKLGVVFDTYQTDRWKRDKAIIKEIAGQEGIGLMTAEAQGDPFIQYAQARKMIKNGIDVLIIIAADQDLASHIVNMSNNHNIPVIAYDRLINNARVDYYISFNPRDIGYLQGTHFKKQSPKGKYILINGPLSDNNSARMHHGQIEALTSIDSSANTPDILYQTYCSEWSSYQGYHHILNCIEAYGTNFDVVIAGNDQIARGVINGLEEYQFDHVLVGGQDTDLSSIRFILDGRQTMTIFKPIREIASKAITAAKSLHHGALPDSLINHQTDNNQTMVPTLFIKPVIVDKNNILRIIQKHEFIDGPIKNFIE